VKTEQKSGAAMAKRRKKFTCQKRNKTDKGVMYCVFDEKHTGGHSWEVK
jgi:hypothetical protein